MSNINLKTPFAKKLQLIAVVGALFYSNLALAQSVEPTNSNMTRSIRADYQGYQAQQAAIQALNDTGKYPTASYALAKAQCWLDVSFHEFTRNDRSSFVAEALDESVKLTQAMTSNPNSVGILASQTKLVNDSQKVRPDLWLRAEQIKASPGFGGLNNCSEKLVACAEVELVHAANEYKQQGWRHSRPYIQIAEDNLNNASLLASQCLPSTVKEIVYVEAPVKPLPAPPAAPVIPVVIAAPVPVAIAAAPVLIPVPAPAKMVPVPFTLAATVLFNYNKKDLTNVLPATKSQMDEWVAKVKASSNNGIKIKSIEVVGHADRANGTGISDYNLQLSQARSETIKQYLITQGISTLITTVTAKGDTQQIEACNKAFKSKKELQECLLPNRRVELIVIGEK
jgi:OmpA-OmpF porin, OOP family